MNNTSYRYPRQAEARVVEGMADTPVVLVAGPRQAGKTTLVSHIAGQEMRYLTLDDDVTLLAAREDPAGLIRSLDRAVIDEIQRAPELLPAIKKSVDEDRRSGRFLLTGSASLMVLPKVTESLAGRMETVTLLPLSQSEIHGETTNWLDNVFAGRIPEAAVPVVGDTLVEIVVKGGYPEALARQTPRRRTAWCRQYVDALIQRDVRDIADIEKQDQLPRFLRALSQMAGKLCNYTKLGGQVGLDSKTAAKYMGVLEQMFLTKRIEPWTDNRLSRIVKTPKLQFIDSGLLAALGGFSAISSPGDRTRFGHFLESFVFGELLKHATTADNDYHICYYRDHDKVEVDYVVENTAGFLAGVEVKAAATVKETDLKGIRRLAKAAGRKWICGIILYDGNITLPLGKNIWAAPLSSLWGKAL
jgi:uncharacterized protein